MDGRLQPPTVSAMSFAFVPAEPLEWSAWAALGRRPDERFSPLELLASVGIGEPCVWALCDGRRIGGAIAGPGMLSHPFLIPPYDNFAALLSALTDYVRGLTPPGEVPVYPGMPLHQMAVAAGVGWRPGREPGDGMVWCRAMCRPAIGASKQPWTPVPEGITLARPRRADARAVARLLHAAYAGEDPVRADEASFYEDYLSSLEAMDAPCRAASSLAWAKAGEGEKPRLMGACLVALYAGQAILWDVAVAPNARRNGLAAVMTGHALAQLDGKHDLLRLFVRHDNPAARLYERMGFFSAQTTCDMVLDAPESEDLP